jgi:hypothetical protein
MEIDSAGLLSNLRLKADTTTIERQLFVVILLWKTLELLEKHDVLM